MTDTPPPGPPPRIVKRYSNRKLYDTVESRYVTLPQIAELVRNGEEVRIVDNTSKEDLTRMTLAQILYEEERKQSRTLPLAALKDLLHTSSERIITSLRGTPMGKLIARAEDPERDPGPAVPEAPPEAPPPDEPVALEGAGEPARAEAADERGGRMAQFVEQSRGALDQWQHRVDERIRTFWGGIHPASQIQSLQAEIRRLEGRVEALEARLGIGRDPDGE